MAKNRDRFVKKRGENIHAKKGKTSPTKTRSLSALRILLFAMIIIALFFGVSLIVRQRIVIISGIEGTDAQKDAFARFTADFASKHGFWTIAVDRNGKDLRNGRNAFFLPFWNHADVSLVSLGADTSLAMREDRYLPIDGATKLIGSSYSPPPGLANVLDFKGKRFFMPARIDPWVMYYSQTMIANAGVQEPRSLQELISSGKKLSDKYLDARFKTMRRLPADPGVYAPVVIAGSDPDSRLSWPVFLAGAETSNETELEALIEYGLSACTILASSNLIHPASENLSLKESLLFFVSGKASYILAPLSSMDSISVLKRNGAKPLSFMPAGRKTERLIMAAVDAFAIPHGCFNVRGAERFLASSYLSDDMRFFAYASSMLPGNTRQGARNEETALLRDKVNFADLIILPPAMVLEEKYLKDILGKVSITAVDN